MKTLVVNVITETSLLVPDYILYQNLSPLKNDNF